MASANDHWCMLLTQTAALAFSRALFSAGNNIAARIPMIVMTTSNSMSVKARLALTGKKIEITLCTVDLLLLRLVAWLASQPDTFPNKESGTWALPRRHSRQGPL